MESALPHVDGVVESSPPEEVDERVGGGEGVHPGQVGLGVVKQVAEVNRVVPDAAACLLLAVSAKESRRFF